MKKLLEQFRFLIPRHPVRNFEIQKYYQNEPKFNGVYSRNNLPKIKDWAYVINLDEFKSIETRWIDLYANNNNITYFDGFGVELIPKEIKKIHGKQKYNNKKIFIEYKHTIQ